MVFNLYWKLKTRRSNAFSMAGYRRGALSALDFYSTIVDDAWIWKDGEWHKQEKENEHHTK